MKHFNKHVQCLLKKEKKKEMSKSHQLQPQQQQVIPTLSKRVGPLNSI